MFLWVVQVSFFLPHLFDRYHHTRVFPNVPQCFFELFRFPSFCRICLIPSYKGVSKCSSMFLWVVQVSFFPPHLFDGSIDFFHNILPNEIKRFPKSVVAHFQSIFLRNPFGLKDRAPFQWPVTVLPWGVRDYFLHSIRTSSIYYLRPTSFFRWRNMVNFFSYIFSDGFPSVPFVTEFLTWWCFYKVFFTSKINLLTILRMVVKIFSLQPYTVFYSVRVCILPMCVTWYVCMNIYL
jgi:hypothetical protein